MSRGIPENHNLLERGEWQDRREAMDDVFEDLRRNKEAMHLIRRTDDKHRYFKSIANTRYALRKVFRIIEEQARGFGLEPLEHQLLLQVYGSAKKRLKIKDLAARLDISPGFASTLVRTLIDRGFVVRSHSDHDQRVSFISLADSSVKTLYDIDKKVELKIESFTSDLSVDERREIIFVMMFYVGAIS